MKKYFALLIGLLVLGCNRAPKKIVYKKDSLKLKQDFLPGVSGPVVKASLKDSLIGIWTDGSDANATFDIRRDSIYYVDQFASYKYSLTADSIKIMYDDGPERFKVYFIKDTLIMDSKDLGASKFWKFKD
jgi:hypothetical protein